MSRAWYAVLMLIMAGLFLRGLENRPVGETQIDSGSVRHRVLVRGEDVRQVLEALVEPVFAEHYLGNRRRRGRVDGRHVARDGARSRGPDLHGIPAE